MEKNIDDILKSISSDILTEDVKKNIATIFNEAVEEKAKTNVTLTVENELSKMDDEHSQKLQKLIEAIDEDHTNKFKQVLTKIDESHTEKLKAIIEKYETELKTGAETLRQELVDKVSNYLDLYIDDTIPTSQLQEAVENIRARKMLDEIKKIVAIDPEFISENFKSALKDGHDTIEKLRKDMDSKIKESVELNQQLITLKSQMLLEAKIKDLPENKKKFVLKIMEGKKPEDIVANFKYVVEMYEANETEKSDALLTEATEKAKTVVAKTDLPKSRIESIVTDNKEINSEDTTKYISGLNSI